MIAEHLNFELIKGLKINEYYSETLEKLEGEDSLFACKRCEISHMKKIFKFGKDSLHDLLKNYMPISVYINDISLAKMNNRHISIYSPYLE